MRARSRCPAVALRPRVCRRQDRKRGDHMLDRRPSPPRAAPVLRTCPPSATAFADPIRRPHPWCAVCKRLGCGMLEIPFSKRRIRRPSLDSWPGVQPPSPREELCERAKTPGPALGLATVHGAHPCHKHGTHATGWCHEASVGGMHAHNRQVMMPFGHGRAIAQLAGGNVGSRARAARVNVSRIPAAALAGHAGRYAVRRSGPIIASRVHYRIPCATSVSPS